MLENTRMPASLVLIKFDNIIYLCKSTKLLFDSILS